MNEAVDAAARVKYPSCTRIVIEDWSYVGPE